MLLSTARMKELLAELAQEFEHVVLDSPRQFVLGALTGCLLILLHSLVDFPLRIPANALLFVALLAVITAPAAGPLLSADPEHAREPIGHAEFRVL